MNADDERILKGEADTRAFGRELGREAVPGTWIALSGPLGAGKTTMVKGIAEGLDIDPDTIASPTFTLVHLHPGRLPLVHVDLYRIGEPVEAATLGLDAIDPDAVVAVEWPERAPGLIPDDAIRIILAHDTPATRRFRRPDTGPLAPDPEAT